MHQVKRKVIIPKMIYEELEQEILMQKWREREREYFQTDYWE
jgi:hypothetical protein